MPTFTVTISRVERCYQSMSLRVYASSRDEAQDIAYDRVMDDPHAYEWETNDSDYDDYEVQDSERESETCTECDGTGDNSDCGVCEGRYKAEEGEEEEEAPTTPKEPPNPRCGCYGRGVYIAGVSWHGGPGSAWIPTSRDAMTPKVHVEVCNACHNEERTPYKEGEKGGDTQAFESMTDEERSKYKKWCKKDEHWSRCKHCQERYPVRAEPAPEEEDPSQVDLSSYGDSELPEEDYDFNDEEGGDER